MGARKKYCTEETGARWAWWSQVEKKSDRSRLKILPMKETA